MSEPRMKKVILEINTNFKGKMTRQRKMFMNNLLKMFSGVEETHDEAVKGLLEYGVRVVGERDPGDDVVIKINGEVVFKGC